MANPNFDGLFSTHNIWRGDDETRCLSDDLDTIEGNIAALNNGKAPADHTHSGYAPASHNHDGYAPASHSHDYAASGHTHAYAPAIEDETYSGCYYRMVNGETEWINPPLVAGEVYRTTERWNGKAVYTVLTSIGPIADASSIDISGYGATRIVRYAGWVDNYTLPHINADNLTASYSVYYSVRNAVIDVNCGTAMAGRQGFVQLWYTKD